MVNEPIKWDYCFGLKGELVKRGFKSNRAAAEALGYSTSTLASVINGWRKPSHEVQRRLCKLLGISFVQLRKLI